MILETERLYLREMTQDDFASLCEILQDDKAMYAYEGAFDDQEVQEWLDRQIFRYQMLGFKKYAFDVLKADEICTITRDINIASQNVAVRNGMKRVDTWTKHYRGVDMPHYRYVIRREETVKDYRNATI